MWQFTSQISSGAALALCVALTLTSGEALAQGKKKVAAPWVGKTAEGKPCSGGQPTSGPFDYLKRGQFAGQLQVVEEHHFDKNVEKLIKGISTEPMGDIDFTLRAFPNHHRALRSAMNFRLMHERWPKRSKGVRAECYLQRAINFSPRDDVLHSMLAYTLHKLDQPERAIEHYKAAIERAPSDMMLQYNIGLALTEAERYPEARAYAETVYAVGFPLPALKRRLLEAGHWEGATVPPKAPKGQKKAKKGKQGKNAKAGKNLSKKQQYAKALGAQGTAKGEDSNATESDSEAAQRKKEQFAAALAAMQAEGADAAKTAEGATPEAAPEGDSKALSRKEQFAAAIAAIQAKNALAESGSADPEPSETGPMEAAPDAGSPAEPEQTGADMATPEMAEPTLAAPEPTEAELTDPEPADTGLADTDPAPTSPTASAEKQPEVDEVQPEDAEVQPETAEPEFAEAAPEPSEMTQPEVAATEPPAAELATTETVAGDVSEALAEPVNDSEAGEPGEAALEATESALATTLQSEPEQDAPTAERTEKAKAPVTAASAHATGLLTLSGAPAEPPEPLVPEEVAQPKKAPNKALAKKNLSKKERLAAAMQSQQAQPGAKGQQAKPNAGGKKLSDKEKFAAVLAAAQKNQAQAPAKNANAQTKKQLFAAALAAKGKKNKEEKLPELTNLDPQTRKDQFAARLAAKGLLELDEPEDEAAEEGSTSTDSIN